MKTTMIYLIMDVVAVMLATGMFGLAAYSVRESIRDEEKDELIVLWLMFAAITALAVALGISKIAGYFA